MSRRARRGRPGARRRARRAAGGERRGRRWDGRSARRRAGWRAGHPAPTVSAAPAVPARAPARRDGLRCRLRRDDLPPLRPRGGAVAHPHGGRDRRGWDEPARVAARWRTRRARDAGVKASKERSISFRCRRSFTGAATTGSCSTRSTASMSASPTRGPPAACQPGGGPREKWTGYAALPPRRRVWRRRRLGRRAHAGWGSSSVPPAGAVLAGLLLAFVAAGLEMLLPGADPAGRRPRPGAPQLHAPLRAQRLDGRRARALARSDDGPAAHALADRGGDRRRDARLHHRSAASRCRSPTSRRAAPATSTGAWTACARSARLSSRAASWRSAPPPSSSPRS